MLPHKKFTPFSKLSRHKQRDLYVKLRGKIKKTASDYGQNFTSHLILNEPDRPAFFNQWFDFYFLGLDGVTIWNTVLYTANEAYWDAISDLAFEEVDRLRPKTEEDFDLDSFLIPVYDKTTGKKLHYTMKEPEKEPALNNLTLSEFVDDYSSKLIREDTGDTAPIFESFKIDKTYRYGIGLFAIVDAPNINAETIEAMITKFHSIGEQNWKNPTPVDRSKLPSDTFQVLAKQYVTT
ncbi:MAG: hypothetical protein RIQ94_2475 [Pseudomonadota bacterium]|jgi:hypothetical protein